MMYYDGWHIGEAEHFDFGKDSVEPAWLLHRLIEICGVRNIIFNLDLYDSIYDQIIHRIEIFINSGTLDKEYLEE